MCFIYEVIYGCHLLSDSETYTVLQIDHFIAHEYFNLKPVTLALQEVHEKKWLYI